jgi:hypothetical protein
MDAQIDVTKLKGYNADWTYKKAAVSTLVPCRHVCGEIVQADLSSDYPIFYNRTNLTGTGVPLTSCQKCESPLTMDWMKKLYYVDPMPYDTAVRTRSKVCSNCWGMLEMSRFCIPTWDEDEGMLLDYRMVICRHCQYETRGYVTSRYVGFSKERDQLNYNAAVIGLSEALELECELPRNEPIRISERSNLAMLGF